LLYSSINEFIYHTAPCTIAKYSKSDGTCVCAFFLVDGLTWQQAVDKCKEKGARLPEIYSATDNDKIFALKVLCLLLALYSLKSCVIVLPPYQKNRYFLLQHAVLRETSTPPSLPPRPGHEAAKLVYKAAKLVYKAAKLVNEVAKRRQTHGIRVLYCS